MKSSFRLHHYCPRLPRFNLNSFLDKPSWVGPSYLGALLNAAETEGYSVFVARAAADHALGNLRSSAADECAATLPIARAVAEQSSSARSFQTSAHGLRPSQSAAAAKAPRAPGAALPARSGAQDEDADIQAALRASLADTAITSRHDAEEASSRMQSPTIVGQRRTRAGEMAGQDTMDEEEETDAHVDAIAPSRRRARGMAPATASTSAASSRGSPYILPTASGGRRRASRQHQLSDEDSTNDRRNLGLSTGGSRDNAITVPDDGDDDDVDDYDDDDDFEELGTAASSAPRSPFLNPALAAHLAGNSNNNSDDDFHSLSSDDDVLGESMISQNAAAVRQQARMPQSRTYDDEDAELQAALAASMRDAGGDGDVTGRQGDTEAASGALADEVAAASWLTDKDAQAIREAQASFGSGAAASTAEAVMARQASSSPPPADVERIARMRAEAQRKIQEEEEARIRGVDPAQSHSKGHAGDEKDAAGPDGGEDSDSSDEDEAPQMSPEEMRRARLARFGT